VIIWLNGTFGCGKTSTAAELHSLVPSSRVFDPETVGYMLQPNLADHPVSDFQHWPPWRPLVVATATELARFTGEHLIAPQTILVRAYLEQIFAGLRDAGLDVFHVVLDAGEEVLRQRIKGSAEAQAWRLGHLAEYRSSRPWMIRAADLAVDTSRLTPAEIAHQIAGALPDGRIGSGGDCRRAAVRANQERASMSITRPEVDFPGGEPPAELRVTDIWEGDGRVAGPGDLVTVHYVGVAYSTGEEFDASWNSGDPLQFRLGAGQVIAGWDQGVAGMRVGGRRQLIIPPGLAYGDRGAGGVIAPGETLIFVCDLVST
jgi:peptidylprolyl isomerase